MTSGGALAQTVGSVTFIDSFVEDTSVAIWTSHTSDPSSYSNGSLVLENVSFRNVSVAVQGSQNTTLLSGATGSMNVEAWGQGHLYNPEGPYGFQGTMSPFPRPDSLVKHGKYYERSKPSYARTPPSQFISVRNYGAKGNGLADDTAALQKTILAAASAGKLVFVDAGTYRVSETIYIPGGSKIVGESFSVIMASGPIFANMSDPKAVVRVGKPREVGHVEWSDMVVATQGPEAGAVLIEWNLASHGQPSGMWDVHTRIGGFAGSKLELADCPATPNTSFGNRTLSSPSTRTSDSSISHGMTANVTIPPVYSNGTAPSARNSSNVDLSYLNKACIGAFMSMHVTKSATGLYMENNWLWTADHSLDTGFTNITVYSGRGLYIESERGNLWVVASSVEHHALYQYQLADTQSIFMGQIQTETAYYQPHPDIRAPFPAKKSFNDPNDAAVCQQNGTNCDGWALRIVNSQDINVYGAGFYSFFNNYNTCEYSKAIRVGSIRRLMADFDVLSLLLPCQR